MDEAREKNYLFQKIIFATPEWVLWSDGDEVLEYSSPYQITKAISANPEVGALSLYISYLWDYANHVRVDGIFGQFRRPSLFRLRRQQVECLSFKSTGHGGNFHCGNVPQGLAGPILDLDVRLKHGGYMPHEQRLSKCHWYRQLDPHNEFEDDYRHLAGIPGSRCAPRPIQIIPWSE